MRWADIDPEVIEFARDQSCDDIADAPLPFSAELLRDRKEWEELVAARDIQVGAEAVGATAEPSVRRRILKVTPRAYDTVKRVLDVVLACLLGLVAAPLCLLLAWTISATSKGPGFCTQRRLGKYRRPFTMWKLRTMSVDSEPDGPFWSVPGDPRVTTIGKFLRQTHLDELPQLYNVLRGEMSLIGPRPERPEIAEMLERVLVTYNDRLAIRPGMIGLAQILYEPHIDISSLYNKLVFERYYVLNRGFWLDMRLFLASPFLMVGVPRPILASLFALPRITHCQGFLARLGDLELSESGRANLALREFIKSLSPSSSDARGSA